MLKHLLYPLETSKDHTNANDAVASLAVVISINLGPHPDDVVNGISSSRILAIKGDDSGSRDERCSR